MQNLNSRLIRSVGDDGFSNAADSDLIWNLIQQCRMRAR